MLAAAVTALGSGLATAPAHADTSTTPPALQTSIKASGPISPTLLYGHGKTLAGGPWGALLLTRGQTDGYVVDNVFGLGTSTGWHSHPGISIIFVVAGTITDYDSSNPGCKGVEYTAGSAFTDVGGTDVHMLRNDGTVQAETIAVQYIAAGQPRKTNATEPAGCHIP
jgi:hypothetical protein